MLAVNEDVHHPGRILVRLNKRGVVLNLIGVEDHDVGIEAGLQLAAMVDPEVLAGKGG